MKVTAGHIESLMERYREGEALYREAIAIDGNRPDAYFHLAANLTAQNKKSLADEYYKKALGFGDVNTTDFLLNKAQYLILNDDIGGAKGTFEQALNKEPDNVYIQLNIAHLFLAAKQYRDLYLFFGAEAGIEKQNPAIQKLVADALMNIEQWDQAHAILQHHDRSTEYDWLLLTGKYHLLKGNYTLAISYLESALGQRTDDPKCYNLLAMAYLAAGKINLAKQDMDQVVDRCS